MGLTGLLGVMGVLGPQRHGASRHAPVPVSLSPIAPRPLISPRSYPIDAALEPDLHPLGQGAPDVLAETEFEASCSIGDTVLPVRVRV